jgi:hypothetical protein
LSFLTEGPFSFDERSFGNAARVFGSGVLGMEAAFEIAMEKSDHRMEGDVQLLEDGLSKVTCELPEVQ